VAEKAVVLGSNSFSGSHFVDYLLDEGLEVLGSATAHYHSVPHFLLAKNLGAL
jgi:nucleoside-diphosphate-sugar epimerase